MTSWQRGKGLPKVKWSLFRDRGTVGIFRGYSLVKEQSQQPQLHLVIWLLLNVADS